MRAVFQGTWSFGLVAALALGCGYEVYTDETEGCPSASAGCPCAEDGGCEGALVCLEGVCGPGEGESTTTSGSTSSTGAGSTSSTGMASSATSSSTSSSGADTTGACIWLCEQDEPSGPECDAFAQDCPDGQKCAPYDMSGDGAWDTTICVEIMGGGQHGEPCTAEGGASGIDDCAEGAMCWNLNEEGVGTCVAQCMGSPEDPICAPPNTACKIMSGGALNLCMPTCQPLQQDCPDSELCIGDPNSDGFVCVLDSSDGMAPEGTPCEFANVCNPGSMCVNPTFYPSPACEGAGGCCAPFCDLQEQGACEGLSVPGAECVGYYEPEPAPPGYESIGVCGIPG